MISWFLTPREREILYEISESWNRFDETSDNITRYFDGSNIVYEIDVPGFNKENLSITLDGKVLTIRGEKKGGDEKKSRSRKIYQRILLPSTGEIDATVSDGVLKITLMSAKKEPIMIEIK